MKIKHLINTDQPVSEWTDYAEQLFQLLVAVYGDSPWSKAYLLADLTNPSSDYFLAESDGVVIGFLAVSTMMNEMEITNLAVHPEFQGKGIASLLLNVLSSFSGTLFLEVRESNLAAQKLYEKFDFKHYHTRKNYYNHPVENALLMNKFQ